MRQTQKAPKRPADRRVLIPAVLAAAALVGIVYGVGWHKVPVLVPPEPVETPAAPPAAVKPPVFDPTAPPGDPFALPPGVAPASAPVEAAEPQLVLERETQVILETTRGGLALDEDGKLRQTYTGRPPKACPT